MPYKVHKSHLAYLEEIGQPTEPLQFVQWVCPNAVTLPQPKIGNVLHLPMAYNDGRGGWEWGWPDDPSHLDYMLVLPDICRGLSTEGPSFAVTNRIHEIVHDGLEVAGIPKERVAVTYAIRYVAPSGHKPSVSQLDACRSFVQADVDYVKPKVIITLGAAALKAVHGKPAKMANIRGNVTLYQSGTGFEAPVVVTDSPKAFLGGYAGLPVFRKELSLARKVAEGRYNLETPPTDGYCQAWSREQVAEVAEVVRAARPEAISLDVEWGNDVEREEFSYPLSIQLGWAPGRAVFIALRGEGGAEIHEESDYRAIINIVEDLLSPDDIQLVGHHLRTDVEQLHRMGMNLDTKVRTGFCTMLVHHLLHNDESQGLDTLCRKYTPQFGAFWQDLEEWLDCTGRRKKHLLHGYRDIPYELLIPYAQRDADVTLQIYHILKKRLDKKPGLKDLYYRIVAPCALHLMDVERQGLLIDEERRREIKAFYEPIRDFYAEKVRQAFNWPSMNVASHAQLKTMLFQGTVYSEAKAAPEGTKPLRLRPLSNTDKHPIPWEQVESEGKARLSSPSTDAENLDLLYYANPQYPALLWLKHHSVVNKLLTAYLAVPPLNDYGVRQDGKSLGHNIEEDGRARTRLSQLTNTGRYTSQKPNLQTWPKKQEAALRAAVVFYKHGCDVKAFEKGVEAGEFAELVLHSVKGCVIAPPGKKLIEIDFQTAEVNTWAFTSGDKALLEVVAQGRDLHSENTVNAFNLPEKKELPDLLIDLANGNRERYNEWKGRVSSKYSSLRIAAKSIIFGIMYGRGARALAREISKTGVDVTVEQCEAIINAIATSYPKAWGMLQDAARSAIELGYVENVFGRRRYFTGISECGNSDIAAAKRQAQNFVIQSTVADLLAQAGATLYEFRYETDIGRQLGFKILLPVHDAFLVEVDEDKVDKTIKAFEIFMGKLNTIPGTNHFLGVDVEVRDRWGK